MSVSIEEISQDVGQSASKSKLRLWLKVLKTQRMIENIVREKLRVEHQTTLPRFDVMAALHKSRTGMKMSELSGELKVSNGNVTGIIDRLVDDGLVMRVPVENDRRAMLVRLTVKGGEVFEEQAAAHESWIADLLVNLEAKDADDLTAKLKQITDRLDPEGKE